MSYLLDVNFLLASRWKSHPQHESAIQWLEGQFSYHTTPIVQLGSLRVSLGPAFQMNRPDVQRSLQTLTGQYAHRFLPDSQHVIHDPECSYKDTTNAHLIALAKSNDLRLATLDERLISKPWAKGIAENPLH